MRKLIWIMILVAGMSFGAVAYFPQSPDRESVLAELTSIAAAPVGHLDGHGSGATGVSDRTFSPKHPLVTPAASDTAAPAKPAPERRDVASAVPLPADRIVGEKPWLTVVTPDPAAVPAGARLTSSKPGDDHTRYELVMSIQKELKRAGCYGGVLNGSWTETTRRAMSAFTERVNSSLPVKEPDYILHTLLKGHALTSCGGDCPKGQSITNDGRCVTNSVLAQSAGQSAAKQPPRTDPRAIASPKPEVSGFTTTISAAVADTRAPAPTATAQVAASLPGRMSIGGPAAPAPAQVVIAPTEAIPQPFSAPTGAGDKFAALDSPDAAVPVVAAPVTGAPAAAPVSALSTPRAGLPGTKSGGADTRTAALSPPVRIYAPGKPRPAVARQKSASASAPRARYGTRSVRSIFANPLGIH